MQEKQGRNDREQGLHRKKGGRNDPEERICKKNVEGMIPKKVYAGKMEE